MQRLSQNCVYLYFDSMTQNSNMVIQDEFESAVKSTDQLTERPSNEVLLKMYALYKQATEGDVIGERPGGFDFKAIAKYNAWEQLKGTDADAAKQQYIDLVKGLQ